MRRISISSDDLPARGELPSEWSLPARAAHYARDVLRLKAGDPIELFDGSGRVLRGELGSVSRDGVTARIASDEVELSGESPCSITLFQAIPKGDRWEWILEKSTELGVTAIQPVVSKRSVVRIPAHKTAAKMQRWERILASAARQCQRTRTPELLEPATLSALLVQASKRSGQIVAHPHPDTTSLSRWAQESGSEEDSLGVWIGPEGGLAEDELSLLLERGVEPVSLGPRILRADTAGIAALSILQSILGDLG